MCIYINKWVVLWRISSTFWSENGRQPCSSPPPHFPLKSAFDLHSGIQSVVRKLGTWLNIYYKYIKMYIIYKCFFQDLPIVLKSDTDNKYEGFHNFLPVNNRNSRVLQIWSIAFHLILKKHSLI